MKTPGALLKEFIVSLSGKAGNTVDAYQRELRHFLDWISQRAGNSGPFNTQQQLTKTALQTYLSHLLSIPISTSEGCTRLWKPEIQFDGTFEGLTPTPKIVDAFSQTTSFAFIKWQYGLAADGCMYDKHNQTTDGSES